MRKAYYIRRFLQREDDAASFLKNVYSHHGIDMRVRAPVTRGMVAGGGQAGGHRHPALLRPRPPPALRALVQVRGQLAGRGGLRGRVSHHTQVVISDIHRHNAHHALLGVQLEPGGGRGLPLLGQ